MPNYTTNTHLEARTLEDVSTLLIEAARISNHRSFVIAGSLCAIGAVMSPPIDMVISCDLDFFPKLDPGRGFIEIAEQLGEGSAFAKEYGFYADPISPRLLLCPDGWEARMVQITLPKGVVAWFMDVNDAAVGKLMRGLENDNRWLKSGLQEGILNSETILQRFRTTHTLTLADVESASEKLHAFGQRQNGGDEHEPNGDIP